MKKKIFAALVIALVFLSVPAYAQNVLDFDLDFLLSELVKNEARAIQDYQNYRNRTIRAFGRISSISGSGTEIYVTGFDALRALKVSFNGSERSKILNLNEGQLITFSGVYTQEVNAWSANIEIKSAVLESNTAEAYFRNGRYLVEERYDYDRGIADYTQAIRLDPNVAVYYSFRGYAYSNKNDYDRAIADYTQAIRLDPKDATYYFQRGALYHLKVDYTRAITDYEAGLRLKPNDSTAKELLQNARQRIPLRW